MSLKSSIWQKNDRLMFKTNVWLVCICMLFATIPITILGKEGHERKELSSKLTTRIWGSPKNTKEVLQIRVLSSVMRKLINRPQAKLNILYPGDDKGTEWANDLRGWLISLGLKSDRIKLSPDSYTEDTIELVIQQKQYN